MPRALPLLLLMMVATPAFARDRLCLDDGWRFHLGDPARVDPKPFDYPELRDLAKASADDFDQDARLSAGRADPVATNLGGDLPPVQGSYDDAQWQPVSLPHDWVVDLPFVHKAEQDKDKFEGTESHGYKDIGPGHNNIGWYRRSFDLPAADRGQSLSIQFDGVYRNSVVWLNGHCLGRHADGYTGFDYDISTVANYGGKNELVVRVDASRPEGWFYEGAGIYRHVWLTVCNPVHVVPGSVAVTFTPGAKPTAPADLHIQYQIRNDSTGPAQLKVASRALSPSQKETDFVTAALTPVLLQAATTVPIDHHISLDQPVLWSTDQPNVYRVELIVDGIGVKYDAVTVSTGFRTIKFDPNKGFLLNGHHVEIRGTCNHQDMAGVGSALPDSLQVYRLQQLKKFGCNAIRTSHNPPTPELLDACDRLGILVMDETRKPGDTPELLNNLRDLVRRDRNHPSVILWSIANEEGGIQGDDKIGVPVATAMKKAIRELDDRPVTAAMNGGWGRGFSRVIDVQGFNYAANFNLDKYHHDHPTLPLIGSENGSTVSTRGVYANDPAAGYVSAYDVNAPSWATLAESWVATYRARPYMAGGFVWTGFDYRGEPTPYSWPCINSHFGLLDTCGFFKDNAYYYQSIWTTAPMVHLLPHWNWPGKDGQPIDVWAYSNGDEVELTLNDKSLGRQKYPPNGHVSWKVPYTPGKLVARAYKAGKGIATDTVETAGPPAKMVLAPDHTDIAFDGKDAVCIAVQIVDAQNRPVPTAANVVHFQTTAGKILGVGNGDPSCHEPDHADQRTTFNGKAMLIWQAPAEKSPVTIRATADGLEPASLTIPAIAATESPPVP